MNEKTVFDYPNSKRVWVNETHYIKRKLEKKKKKHYQQAFIVHTGFAGWKPTNNNVNYCKAL